MNDARRLAATSAATFAGIAAVLSGLALMQSGGIGDCGADCAAALASRWSTIPFGARLNTEFGLPVALLGVMYFSGLAAWLFLVMGQPNVSRGQFRATFAVGLLGACVSAAYVAIMGNSGQLCPLCLATHVVNFAMLPFLWLTAPTDAEPVPNFNGRFVAAVALMLVACELALWLGWDSSRLRGEQRELIAALARAAGNSATASTPATFAPEPKATARPADASPAALIVATQQPALTVEIYTDLMCLGCRFFERTLLEDYVPLFEGRINVTLRHYPLCTDCNPGANNVHPSACQAAYALEAARVQGGAQAVLKMLHQIDPQRPRSFADDDLKQLAKSCGLDADRLSRDMQSEAVHERVRQDVEHGKAAGVQQTPTIVLDGQVLAGALRDESAFWRELAKKQMASQSSAASIASAASGSNTVARPTINPGLETSSPGSAATEPVAVTNVIRTKPSDDERESIAKEMLETHDTNGDGALDRKEWSKLYNDGSIIDKDHDGRITLAEIKAGIVEIQSPGDGPAPAAKGALPKPGAEVPRISTIFPGDRLELKGPALDGSTFDLAALRGKPVLVAFWATWCPHCVDESAELLRLYRTYHDRDLELVGISSDSDPERVRQFVKLNEMPWPQLFSPTPETRGRRNPWAVKYNVLAYPTLFLVGADGTVKEVHLRGRELELAVAKELAVDPVSEQEAAQQTAAIKVQMPATVTEYEAPQQLKVGDHISFTGTMVDGKQFDSAVHRGKATLVAFWASWCPHCRKELPVLADLQARYHDRGLKIVGVSLDRTYNDLQKYLADNPLPWTTLYRDQDGLRSFNDPLARWFGVHGIPTLFLLDEEGRIAALNVRGPKLEQEIAKLLGEAPPAVASAAADPADHQPAPSPVAAIEKSNSSRRKPKTVTDPKMLQRIAEVMMKKFDKNDDGWLEPSEWEKSSSSLGTFDTDKDGKLTLKELTAAIAFSQKIKAKQDEKKAGAAHSADPTAAIKGE